MVDNLTISKPYAQTERALSTHAYSKKFLKDYPELIYFLLQIKHACAWANVKLQLIAFADYEIIAQACLNLTHQYEWFTADMLQGGGGVTIHMNVNEAICHHIPLVLQNAKYGGIPHPSSPVNERGDNGYIGDEAWLQKVNLSQSTTDVCSTALSLTLAQEIHSCTKHLVSLINAFEQFSNRHMHVKSIGRTCLRDAGAIHFGERFLGFSKLIGRTMEGFKQLHEFAYCNLGATVLGTGAGIAKHLQQKYSHLAADKLATLTNLKIRMHPHFIDSIQNRDDLYTLACTIELLAVNLLKINKDIRLLASGPMSGFGELELPPIIKGSTFYANKTNPTLEETVIQMAFYVLGLIKSAKLGLEHAELDINIYYMFSSVCLIDSLQLINTLLPKYICFSLNKLKITASEHHE